MRSILFGTLRALVCGGYQCDLLLLVPYSDLARHRLKDIYGKLFHLGIRGFCDV